MTAATGYQFRKAPGRGKSKTTREHVLIAEKILGYRLPPHVVVHHVNEIRDDNRNSNLVICSRAYHVFLHLRMRALAACGHADWRRCVCCKEYAPEAELVAHGKAGKNRIHLQCRKAAWRAYAELRRAA